MLEKTNIEDRLKHQRNKRVSEATLLKEVQEIFLKNNEERETIQARMAEEPQEQETNEFDIDLLKSEAIFHVSEINSIFFVRKYFRAKKKINIFKIK